MNRLKSILVNLLTNEAKNLAPTFSKGFVSQIDSNIISAGCENHKFHHIYIVQLHTYVGVSNFWGGSCLTTPTCAYICVFYDVTVHNTNWKWVIPPPSLCKKVNNNPFSVQ